MGYQDRDYYQDSRSGGGWGMDSVTPVVKYLILANIVVFVAQIFLTQDVPAADRDVLRRIQTEQRKEMLRRDRLERDAAEGKEPDDRERQRIEKSLEDLQKEMMKLARSGAFGGRVSLVQDWFELDTEKVVYQGQVWRLLTYAFCHHRESFWHIFFNMLFLYWGGVTLEAMVGSREFLLFYLTAAITSGLAFLGLELYTGAHSAVIGASGAVMGVVMLYACHFPYQTILVFWIIPVQIRWLVLLYVLVDLHPVLLALAGDRPMSGIAHSSHLGGLAFGFLYWRFGWRLENLGGGVLEGRLPRWQRRPRLRIVRAPEWDEEDRPEPSRLDDILRKVHEQGQDSLTGEERAVLQEESDRLRRRRRP